MASSYSDSPISTAVEFTELTGGAGSSLTGVMPGPDLAAAGYVEVEYSASGTTAGRTPEGAAPPADFTTRVLLRRPESQEAFSGTLIVEWLNVSSGSDVAAEYTYVGPEIVRAGHAWAGVSAQYTGVAGGDASVENIDAGPSGLAAKDPERYAGLHHPGDAYCYDLFATVAAGLAAPGGPMAGLHVDRLLATGESQSAMALTTYVAEFAAEHRLFDGFLIHSRAMGGLPLAPAGAPADISFAYREPVVTFPDAGPPVFVVQTETDVLTDFRSYLARQPDTDRYRLWEVAGTSHADYAQIGPFESVLNCPDPVNRGQQRYVLRAALRHLDAWVRGTGVPPIAERLTLTGPDDRPVYAVDEVGNVRGGVRTPCVDAPTQVLSGAIPKPTSRICLLFGSTHPLPPGLLLERYGSPEDYLHSYGVAADAAIAAGVVLPEDRAELLDESNPDLVG